MQNQEQENYESKGGYCVIHTNLLDNGACIDAEKHEQKLKEIIIEIIKEYNMQNQEQKEKWEKRFDKEFGNSKEYHKEIRFCDGKHCEKFNCFVFRIKFFISSLLQSERDKIENALNKVLESDNISISIMGDIITVAKNNKIEKYGNL